MGGENFREVGSREREAINVRARARSLKAESRTASRRARNRVAQSRVGVGNASISGAALVTSLVSGGTERVKSTPLRIPTSRAWLRAAV